jgi:LSD1 subclass zinc finger protein
MREHFYSKTIEPLLNGPTIDLILYLQSVGVLNKVRMCNGCRTPLKLVQYARSVDLYAFRCMKTACKSYKKYFSIRTNSIFNNCNFSLVVGLKLCWKWLGDATQKEIIREVDVERKVLIRFFMKLRRCCENFIMHNPVMLGGNNIVINLDESLFRHKPKYHRGRLTKHELWVFGVADTSFTPAHIYLELVEDRSAATLLPIVKRVLRHNSIVISDDWASYRRIDEILGFDNLIVNHSLNFVDPITGAHTQHIESYWAKVKLRIKVKKGVFGENLHSYLQEWMWKDNVYEGCWDTFLVLIKLYI